jgi:co-chaperonin GroES (HSP10)
MVEEEKKQEGILIMPNQQKEFVKATVMAIGEKVEIPVEISDTVIIRFHCGHKFNSDSGKELYRVISEAEVIGIENAQ